MALTSLPFRGRGTPDGGRRVDLHRLEHLAGAAEGDSDRRVTVALLRSGVAARPAVARSGGRERCVEPTNDGLDAGSVEGSRRAYPHGERIGPGGPRALDLERPPEDAPRRVGEAER